MVGQPEVNPRVRPDGANFCVARDSGTAQVTTRRLALLSAPVCAPLRVRSARKTSASRWEHLEQFWHRQPPCLGRVKGSHLAASVRSSHADLPKGRRSLARQGLLKRPLNPIDFFADYSDRLLVFRWV